MSPRQLTVLQVLPALESGGVERGVLETAEALVTLRRGLPAESDDSGMLIAEL